MPFCPGVTVKSVTAPGAPFCTLVNGMWSPVTLHPASKVPISTAAAVLMSTVARNVCSASAPAQYRVLSVWSNSADCKYHGI